jgi:hypothetical protein
MLPSITAQPQKKLSKEQSAFNKLTKKIEKLRRNITQEKEDMESLLGYYSAEIYPLEQQLSSHHIEMVPILFAFLDNGKRISQTEKKALRQVLAGLLNRIFSTSVHKPDEKMKEVFQEINGVSYEQAVEESFEASKSEMEYMYRNMGFDIDLDDISPNDSPEEVMRKMAEKRHKMNHQKEAKDAQKSNQKKTKKQIQIEEQESQKEELKKKNLSAIYRQLVKAIHPDLEQDETKRLEKEQIMAQLTIAYQKNDLPTLLTLEMQWLQKDYNHLGSLPDDKLKLYNQILKEQVAELELKLDAVMMDDRFEPLSRFEHPIHGLNVGILWQERQYITESCESISCSLARLKTTDAAAEIKDIIKNYKTAMKASRNVEFL